MNTRFLLPVEFSGSYAVLPVFYLASAVLLIRVPLGLPNKQSSLTTAISLGEILRRPRIRLAIVSAAMAYATMSLIMTATPISMHVMDQHSVEATADVVRGHLLGMFAPSLVSGWLVARLGIARMLWLGVLCNAVCIALAVSGQELWQYRFALIALGIGWNLLFVSGTTLLATVCRGNELLRAQGFNDFAMFATMALASMSAGALLSSIGWATMNLLALILLTLVVFGLIRNWGRID